MADESDLTALTAEREALRAIAFGRAVTPDELARAEQARAELDALDTTAAAARSAAAVPPPAQPAGEHTVAETATDSGNVTDTSTDSNTDSDPHTDRLPRRRGRTLVLAVGCVLLGAVLGAVGTGLWTGASGPTSYGSGADGAPSALADSILTSNDPTTSPLTDDELADRALVDLQLSQDSTSLIARANRMLGGDVAAAKAVLDRRRAASDRIPGTADTNLEPLSSRRIYGGGTQSVYAARSVEKEYCLVVVRADSSATSCVAPTQFARLGIWTESSGGGTSNVGARWDGNVLQLAVDSYGG